MLVLADLPKWFWLVFGIPLGLVLGSFLNVVIHRLPRDESIVWPGSRCASCGTPIKANDNVPLLGWLLLRGRARCCKAPISPRYPLVELIGGLLAWAVIERVVLSRPSDVPLWQAGVLFLGSLALGLGLVAVAFIDLEHMIVPDEITYGGAVVGLLLSPVRADVITSWDSLLVVLGPSALRSLVGAVIGFVIVWLPFDLLYRLLRGRPGMGLGDAKLVMLAGAWFGLPGAVFALLAGAVQGTLVALPVLLIKGRIEEPAAVIEERQALRAAIEAAEGEERAVLERELSLDPLADEPGEGFARARLPFGPFLALATVELLLFEDVLWDALQQL